MLMSAALCVLYNQYHGKKTPSNGNNSVRKNIPTTLAQILYAHRSLYVNNNELIRNKPFRALNLSHVHAEGESQPIK